MGLPNVPAMWKNLSGYPFGRQIFSWAFSLYAPYFLTIRPTVIDLKPGFAHVTMNQRWAVQNHIKTVHAIAVCNLVEMTMGIVAESTIPSHLRWLPMGMNIDYLKKATGKLHGTSAIDPETFFTLPQYPGEVKVPVEVKNDEGVVVSKAEVSYVEFKQFFCMAVVQTVNLFYF
jgi:acyl-coenzyme A thioesterase PaaI-like protein